MANDPAPCSTAALSALPVTPALPAVLRPVQAGDAPAMQAFLLALSPVSRRLRFHGAINGCSAALLRCLTEAAGRRHLALVASECGVDGQRIVGEARCYVAADGRSAEFALVVADAAQGSGLARRLLQALAEQAAAAGVREFIGEVLDENPRMQAFLRREAYVQGPGEEPGVQRWTRRLVPPPQPVPARGPAPWHRPVSVLRRAWPSRVWTGHAA